MLFLSLSCFSLNTSIIKISSNKLKDIIDFAYQELESLYEKDEIRSMIYSIIEHFTGYDLMKILTYKDELKVSESELLKINFAIKDLKKEKPLQQILGYCDFLDVRIEVNQHVLIPRVETEEIVQRVIKENKGRKNLKIAESCSFCLLFVGETLAVYCFFYP